MAYTSTFLDKEITILNRVSAEDGKFGRNSAGVRYKKGSTIHAGVTWVKGNRALREGAMDVYNIYHIQCRYNEELTRESRILYDGKVLEIGDFKCDKRANETDCRNCMELTGNVEIEE